MGHALGLGHANFDADIMSQRLSSEGTMSISECNINGILQANHWKLVNNENTPDSPKRVFCELLSLFCPFSLD
jgi:hypothetical protein